MFSDIDANQYHCKVKEKMEVFDSIPPFIFMSYEKAWALTPPPASCPLCQWFCCKMSRCDITTSWRAVTWHHVTFWCHGMTSDDVRWRHVMKSHHNVKCRHMTWQSESAHINLSETPKIMFFNMATLTFDLWPWPLYSSEISSKSTPVPNFRSVPQTVWLWERSLTDRRTDGHTRTRDQFYILVPRFP